MFDRHAPLPYKLGILESMLWILFAIIANVLFAVSNLFDKFLIEKRVRDPLALTVFGGWIDLLFTLIIVLIHGLSITGPLQAGVLLLSGVLVELALIPYFKALSLEDASRISPLFQSMPVFVLLLSSIFLRETLTHRQLLGFLLILSGSFIVSMHKTDAGIFKIRKAFWWVLLASILWALPAVMFKFVVIKQTFWDALALEFFGVAIGATILFFLYKTRVLAQIRDIGAGTWSILNINELIYIAGRVSNFYAITLGLVSLVAVLGGTIPLFVFLFGLVLSLWFPGIIKEDITKSSIVTKISSIILVACGLWFITL
ncbi:MAG: EamA family transporter [Deltaproteobacteria bacterium]|nr:EamA family transporter [Deltaproteobacteria bacterium]